MLAERPADSVVLSSADAVLTLGELREWASDLAGRLRAEGIAGPDVRVTTPPVPSAALVAVLLAVFEVGAVPAYGQRHDRAGAFVRRAEEEDGGWLITTGPRFDPAEDTGPSGPDAPAWSAQDTDQEGAAAALSHGALAAAVAAVADRLSVTPEDDVVLLDGGSPPSPVDLLMPLTHARSLLLSGVQLAPPGPPGAFVLADPPTWRRVLTEGWEPRPGHGWCVSVRCWRPIWWTCSHGPAARCSWAVPVPGRRRPRSPSPRWTRDGDAVSDRRPPVWSAVCWTRGAGPWPPVWSASCSSRTGRVPPCRRGCGAAGPGTGRWRWSGPVRAGCSPGTAPSRRRASRGCSTGSPGWRPRP
ncbi:hypothetical protein ACFQZ0_02095 [Streptomyces erythrogriseus]